MRYFIEFSYNGTNYHGWQIQPNAITVQEVLEKNLSILLRHTIRVTGAGRTDTGVHAQQMYAHFNSFSSVDCDSITYKLNALLPNDIAVHKLFLVEDEAHARFDATSRTYEYHIHIQKNAFNSNQSWLNARELNLDQMNEAASLLLKYTDFKCFSKSNTDVNTYNCDITYARWTKSGNQILFTVTADRFLRNMVRAIVGTLIEIGMGKKDMSNLATIIESRDRGKAGLSVPAHGLFLTKIDYPYVKSDN